MESYEKSLERAASLGHPAIFDALVKCRSMLLTHDNIAVSISGGSDSDIVLDIVERCRGDKELRYVWFNTGLEFEATKRHLDYLEGRYGINIERIKAAKSIPAAVHEHGQPFLSKYVSEEIERLQRHGFRFEDRPIEELIAEFPGISSSIRWWCNDYPNSKYGISQHNIARNRGLKEFLIENPPPFRVSSSCCYYAKKKTAKEFVRANNIGLQILGIRKAEGGVRGIHYKACYIPGQNAKHFPVFWFTQDDKKAYNSAFAIANSDCYGKYGLYRTGCVGCPFGYRYSTNEQEALRLYEPKLYKAAQNLFSDSYAYTELYLAFQADYFAKRKAQKQITFDELEDNDGSTL